MSNLVYQKQETLNSIEGLSGLIIHVSIFGTCFNPDDLFDSSYSSGLILTDIKKKNYFLRVPTAPL